MIDKETAKALIITFILFGEFHEDYERTVELAHLYNQLITGKDIEELMLMFNPRESETMFEQRKRITQHITPAISNSIMSPFYKVTKSQRVTKKFDIEKKDKIYEISDRITNFFPSDGTQNGLDAFIQTRFVELTFTDPNAFIVIEYPKFDNKKEKPQPRPFEVKSEDVISFEYIRAKLAYLMIKQDKILEDKKGEDKSAQDITIYCDNFAIKFVEYAEAPSNFTQTQNQFYYTTQSEDGIGGGRHFIGTIYETKTKNVPAFRIGYKRDLDTDGRTFVNPFHAAICYFKKSIKTVSEFDLTNALHTFPQKLQYVGRCPGDGENACNKGFTAMGRVCDRCGGTGEMLHTTSQDVITMPLPESKEDYIPLSDMLVYKGPPIELLEFQKRLVESTIIDVHKTVFNTTSMVEKSIVKTATEQTNDMESAYDALEPFGKKVSQVWMQIVRQIIILTENKETALLHRYPADFKLKTKEQLYTELTTLNGSGAPSFIIDSITEDLASLIYVDDAELLLKYKVKRKFFPFLGKTTDEIAYLLASDLNEIKEKVLYANYDRIFNILETENKDFYITEESIQRELIYKKVDEIINALPKSDTAITLQ